MVNFFWLGLQHPLAVPAHLIALLALGLLTGQQGKTHWRTVLPGFFASLLVGLILTRFLHAPWDAELVLLVLASGMGMLAALQWRLPVWLLGGLALMIGVVIGLDSGVSPVPGLRGNRIPAALVGAGMGAGLCLLLATVLGFYLHKLWQGIGVRVLGAWITAGAVMVLTLALSGALRSLP